MGERVMMLMVVILSTVCVFAHTHSNEPPHAKYSKEINEQAAQSAGLEHNVHDHTHGHSHGSSKCPYAHSTGKQYIARSQSHLWTYAIGATLLISAAPCILLLFIPIQDNSPSNGPWLKVLLAFGSGGLLGDAFLHLIPHALPDGSHSHSHSFTMGHSHEPHDMSVGGWVLTGIIAFLLVEKLVRIIRGEDSHCHSHDVGARKKTDHSDDDLIASEDKAPEIKETKISQADKQEPDRIKVAAYLNLVADFAHNFTDGLAIGASFIAGNTVGVVTMITVLVHEVPHEIGDFAILIQSGYSKKKAMTIQLVTALGALSGCCLSLWVADPAALADAASSSWILPFTAGGFIYIATVSVIPELLENSSTGQSIREILALLTGIFMMYLIAMYE